MIRSEPIRLPFRFATGDVVSRFLQALAKDAQILGSRCQGCERVACPARPCCPWCCAEECDLVPVGPAGVVIAIASTADRGSYGLVRLDGADGAMLHRVLDDALVVGSRVVATFAAERTVSITAIAGFAAEVT